MRSFWIKIHLYLASFFLPLLLLMAVSGGAYLQGFKGTVESAPIPVLNPVPLDTTASDLKQEVDGFLQANGIVHNFEYVKVSGKTLITRPTSRDYYEIDTRSDVPTVTLQQPDLLKRIVELHKGHGPGLFKNLQKVMALGLIVILLSGFWLGFTSAALRTPTMITTLAGLALAFATGFLL